MSFDDVAARFKNKQAEQEQQLPHEPVDPAELEAIRARMLGVLIRDAREASGYSQEGLAEAIGISDDDLRDWEYGRNVPSLPQVELIAYTLQVPLSHFWGTVTFEQQRQQRIVDVSEYTILRNRMIGVLINSARETKNLSAAELGASLNIDVDDIRGYETGQLPVPMTVLVALSSALNVNMSYFLDDSGRVGEFLEIREALELFEQMPEDVREFVSVPANQVYIRVAMALAEIPTNNLRTLAENLLDITM
jgi:transcriptional regulator with XRE-family HTH domain